MVKPFPMCDIGVEPVSVRGRLYYHLDPMYAQECVDVPEAVEQDHHGRPSFRVSGRIFATLWNEDRMNVMVDEEGVRTAVERAPETCEAVWWGKRLAAVAVTLSAVEQPLLGELLADAWEGKAPRHLLPNR